MTSHHAPERGPRRFKPYPAYKNSGVEWLGEIPAHWEAVPIRALARPGFKTFTDGDWIESPFIRAEGIRLIQTGNVGVGEYREQGFRFVDEETFRAFRCTEVLPGDVLICRLADPVGRACLAPDLSCRMITSVDVCILKTPPTVDAGFVVFALSGGSYLSWMSGICRGGTRDRVSRSMLGSIRIQKPPYDEQRTIAAFLDRETTKIDALVAKKERLIERLQEKRTAVITRAVTKGLDPNVPMKDSGVEWLGEIPAHWEVQPLKHVANFTNGVAFKPEDWGDEGTPIIRIENLNGGGNFNYTTRQVPSKFHASEGDLLFGWSGNRGTSFGPFLWPGKGVHYVNQHIFRVVDFDVDKSWLYWVLRAVTFYVEKQAHGIIGMVHITRGDLGKIPIPLMSRREQQAIADFLDAESKRIDWILAKIREAVDRLNELRTALISAAVTGKIDVRGEIA